MLKDEELVIGPGVRRLLGVTGDGSKVRPPNPSQHDEWKAVFIQCTTADKILKAGTNFMFCELDIVKL